MWAGGTLRRLRCGHWGSRDHGLTACCPGNVHALQPVRVWRIGAPCHRACRCGCRCRQCGAGQPARRGSHPLPIALLLAGVWSCWTRALYSLSTRPALQVGTRTTQTPCNYLCEQIHYNDASVVVAGAVAVLGADRALRTLLVSFNGLSSVAKRL